MGTFSQLLYWLQDLIVRDLTYSYHFPTTFLYFLTSSSRGVKESIAGNPLSSLPGIALPSPTPLEPTPKRWSSQPAYSYIQIDCSADVSLTNLLNEVHWTCQSPQCFNQGIFYSPWCCHWHGSNSKAVTGEDHLSPLLQGPNVPS